MPSGDSMILVNRTNGNYHIARQEFPGTMQVLTRTALDES